MLISALNYAPTLANMRREAMHPCRTIASVHIKTPVEIDSGMMIADEPTGHVFILLRSSYVDASSARHTEGSIYTLDSGRLTVVNRQPLNFYPATMVVDSYTQRAFVAASTAFGIDTATNMVHIVDLHTGLVIGAKTVGKYMTDVAVDGRTNRVFMPDTDNNSVRVLDARTGFLLRTIKTGSHPIRVVVAEQTNRVFVINQGDESHLGMVSVLDARSGAVLGTAGTVTGSDTDAVFAIDDRTRRVFSVADHVVTVRDATSGAIVRTITVPGGATSALAVSTTTNRVFVVNSDHGTVSMLDAQSGTVLRTVVVGPNPTDAVIYERRHLALVVNQSNSSHPSTMSVLDAMTGQVKGAVAIGVRPLAIAVSPKMGRAFVVGGTSGTISVLGYCVSS